MDDNFFGVTDPGKQRQNNEDAFIAQPTSNGRYIIACVIDGVGGYSGGEIAAALARETILQRLDKLSATRGDIIAILIDAFNQANEKIWQEKQTAKQHHSMACVLTLAVVDIAGNQF
jgi:serine/threonine protein phosphatase PrpC